MDTSEDSLTFENVQALARELHQEGVSLVEIYHYLDNFRQYLGRHGRAAEEGLVSDCLNCMLGFCAPDQIWFDGSLTYEEVEAYQGTHETRVILSGCSGGGKSTLLRELAQRGYIVWPEPGRLVVQEQLNIGGDGVPWENALLFTELCAQKAIEFYDAAAKLDGPIFFDRSPFDNYFGLKRHDMPIPVSVENAVTHCRYHRMVFVTPPWEEIFVNDNERRHSFAEAVAEYEGLLEGYAGLGFQVVVLPRITVAERADFIEAQLSMKSAGQG
ncbi:MAG: AAA family ATPase [Armatimonas sp.]